MTNILPHSAIKRSILGHVMLCGLLSLAGTIQAIIPAKQPAPTASNDNDCSEDHQEMALPLPAGQLLIPANGECLYTTIIMGYLLPVQPETAKVTARIDQLFGMQPAYYLNELHQTLAHPTHYLSYLRSDAFSTLVTAFMACMQIKKGTWGGPQEIQTIATKLKVNIQAYYPDPNHPTNLVQSDLTKPADKVTANTDITIHIVRDKVHPSELLSQAEKASAEDNPHYQHYRLLQYRLPPAISIPLLSSGASLILHTRELPQKVQSKWFEAAKKGESTLLEDLYNNYTINVNTKDRGGNTALLWSAFKEHIACVKFLVQKNADIHTKNKAGRTALLSTTKQGHTACLKYLRREGADIHIKDKQGRTALLLSAYTGNLACINYLVEQGADLHAKDNQGRTALLLSAYHGHLACVKYLVEQGADIHVRDKEESTALLLSAYQGQLDCVKLLLRQGADMEHKNKAGYTALLWCAQEGQLDCLKYLHQQGAAINTQDEYRNSPLLLSAYKGHLEVVQYLAQQGAHIEAKNEKGSTALLLSAYKGHLDCLKYLAQQGADIHAENNQESTALIWSAWQGHLDCVVWLLQQGADINATDKEKNTALLRSAQKGYVDCVNYLLQQGTYIVTPEDLRSLDIEKVNFHTTTLPLNLSGANLTQAKLPKNLSKHNLTHANLNHTNLVNVKLPKNLSDTNLAYANLTGKHFTATNFEGTQLQGAILASTLCDYQQCFRDHIKFDSKDTKPVGWWYRDHLCKELKSIAYVYPRLSQDSHKAELLQIASGLAYLPYWAGIEFDIKIAYWSCKLFLLKKQLSSELEQQFVSLLGGNIAYDAEYYCWQTDYPQKQVAEEKEAPHNDFNQYLKTFQAGLQQYNVKAKEEWAYIWYRDNIARNIQGLQKTYPQLTNNHQRLKKEAVSIAFQLSILYQYAHLLFLFRYLFLQNRLIRLKKSAGKAIEDTIHYNIINLANQTTEVLD